MNLGIHPFRAALAVAAAGCLIAGVAQPATAAPPDSVPSGAPRSHGGRVPTVNRVNRSGWG